MTRSWSRLAVYAFLGAQAVVGLYLSHLYAYRLGASAEGQSVAKTVTHEDEDADSLHLFYGLLALRVYDRYPDSGTKDDKVAARSLTQTWADGVERHVIPRLQKQGRNDEVDLLTHRVSEARSLLAAAEKKSPPDRASSKQGEQK